MNMQAMMKQAQKLQKDMMETQKKIEAMTFEGKSSITIDSDSMDKDEIEMLQDMIMVAINDAMKQVDKVTEEKMGVYTKGLPGLF